MLDHILERRLLTLNVFSNGWNSQSGAENTNGIWQKLFVGPAHSLPIVCDKIVAFLSREELRKQNDVVTNVSKASISPFLMTLATDLSSKPFEMTLAQFNDSLNYDFDAIDENVSWRVWRRGVAVKEGQDLAFRTVRLEGSRWSCSCNLLVYRGIPCKHVLRIMTHLQIRVPLEVVNSRWYKRSLQPKVTLRNESPFLAKLQLKGDQEVEKVVDAAPQFDEDDEDVLGMRLDSFDLIGPADFDERAASIGFLVGEGSDIDAESADALVLERGPKEPVKVTRKERRNELSNRFYHLLQRIGFGPKSIELMDDLDKALTLWEEQNLSESAGIGLSASVRTLGRPPEHALKPGNQKPRSNGVASKKRYRCSICHSTAHTAGPRCPEACVECASKRGVKAHRKGACAAPANGSKRARQQVNACDKNDGGPAIGKFFHFAKVFAD